MSYGNLSSPFCEILPSLFEEVSIELITKGLQIPLSGNLSSYHQFSDKERNGLTLTIDMFSCNNLRICSLLHPNSTWWLSSTNPAIRKSPSEGSLPYVEARITAVNFSSIHLKIQTSENHAALHLTDMLKAPDCALEWTVSRADKLAVRTVWEEWWRHGVEKLPVGTQKLLSVLRHPIRAQHINKDESIYSSIPSAPGGVTFQPHPVQLIRSLLAKPNGKISSIILGDSPSKQAFLSLFLQVSAQTQTNKTLVVLGSELHTQQLETEMTSCDLQLLHSKLTKNYVILDGQEILCLDKAVKPAGIENCQIVVCNGLSAVIALLKSDIGLKSRKLHFQHVVVDETGSASLLYTLLAMNLGARIHLLSDPLKDSPRLTQSLPDLREQLSTCKLPELLDICNDRCLSEEIWSLAVSDQMGDFDCHIVKPFSMLTVSPSSRACDLGPPTRVLSDLALHFKYDYVWEKARFGKENRHINQGLMFLEYYESQSELTPPFTNPHFQCTSNYLEALVIGHFLKQHQQEFSQKSVGIVAPFNSQVTLITQVLRQLFSSNTESNCLPFLFVTTTDSLANYPVPDVVLYSVTTTKAKIPGQRKLGFTSGVLAHEKGVIQVLAHTAELLVVVGCREIYALRADKNSLDNFPFSRLETLKQQAEFNNDIFLLKWTGAGNPFYFESSCSSKYKQSTSRVDFISGLDCLAECYVEQRDFLSDKIKWKATSLIPQELEYSSGAFQSKEPMMVTPAEKASFLEKWRCLLPETADHRVLTRICDKSSVWLMPTVRDYLKMKESDVAFSHEEMALFEHMSSIERGQELFLPDRTTMREPLLGDFSKPTTLDRHSFETDPGVYLRTRFGGSELTKAEMDVVTRYQDYLFEKRDFSIEDLVSDTEPQLSLGLFSVGGEKDLNKVLKRLLETESREAAAARRLAEKLRWRDHSCTFASQYRCRAQTGCLWGNTETDIHWLKEKYGRLVSSPKEFRMLVDQNNQLEKYKDYSTEHIWKKARIKLTEEVPNILRKAHIKEQELKKQVRENMAREKEGLDRQSHDNTDVMNTGFEESVLIDQHVPRVEAPKPNEVKQLELLKTHGDLNKNPLPEATIVSQTAIFHRLSDYKYMGHKHTWLIKRFVGLLKYEDLLHLLELGDCYEQEGYNPLNSWLSLWKGEPWADRVREILRTLAQKHVDQSCLMIQGEPKRPPPNSDLFSGWKNPTPSAEIYQIKDLFRNRLHPNTEHGWDSYTNDWVVDKFGGLLLTDELIQIASAQLNSADWRLTEYGSFLEFQNSRDAQCRIVGQIVSRMLFPQEDQQEANNKIEVPNQVSESGNEFSKQNPNTRPGGAVHNQETIELPNKTVTSTTEPKPTTAQSLGLPQRDAAQPQPKASVPPAISLQPATNRQGGSATNTVQQTAQPAHVEPVESEHDAKARQLKTWLRQDLNANPGDCKQLIPNGFFLLHHQDDSWPSILKLQRVQEDSTIRDVLERLLERKWPGKFKKTPPPSQNQNPFAVSGVEDQASDPRSVGSAYGSKQDNPFLNDTTVVTPSIPTFHSGKTLTTETNEHPSESETMESAVVPHNSYRAAEEEQPPEIRSEPVVSHRPKNELLFVQVPNLFTERKRFFVRKKKKERETNASDRYLNSQAVSSQPQTKPVASFTKEIALKHKLVLTEIPRRHAPIAPKPQQVQANPFSTQGTVQGRVVSGTTYGQPCTSTVHNPFADAPQVQPTTNPNPFESDDPFESNTQIVPASTRQTAYEQPPGNINYPQSRINPTHPNTAVQVEAGSQQRPVSVQPQQTNNFNPFLD